MQHIISICDTTATPQDAETRAALARQVAAFLNERAAQGELAGFGSAVRVVAVDGAVLVKRA